MPSRNKVVKLFQALSSPKTTTPHITTLLSRKPISSLALQSLSTASPIDPHDALYTILKKRYSSVDTVITALNGCSVDPSHGLISELLKKFSNDWVPALGVFIWAKHRTGYVHSPQLYDSMVEVLGKCRRFKLMWDLVKEMNSFNGYVSFLTMTKVVRCLVKGGYFNEAIEGFRGFENFGVRLGVDALNVLMDALVKKGRVDLAESVFMEFRDRLPCDIVSFTVLIHGYCKAKKVEEARRIMDEMERYEVRPNVFSYGCLVELYCRMKDFGNVEAILSEMQEKGCKPNAVTYSSYVFALGKDGQMSQALEVIERMRRDCAKETSVYSSLIFVLCQSGRLNDALDVFEHMDDEGVCRDLITYYNMIACCCAHSKMEDALKLLGRMEQDSCKPELKTYVPLLSLSCRMKKMKVLRYLLSHMFKSSVTIDASTYALLVKELCKVGEPKYAAFFFSEMVSRGMVPQDKIYILLLQELKRKKMADLMGKVERLMLRAKSQR